MMISGTVAMLYVAGSLVLALIAFVVGRNTAIKKQQARQQTKSDQNYEKYLDWRGLR